MQYASLGLEAESIESNISDHAPLDSALANINALGQASINVLMSSLLTVSDKFPVRSMPVPILNANAQAVLDRCRDDIQQALDAVIDGSDIGIKDYVDGFNERLIQARTTSALLGPPKKTLFSNNWKTNPVF